MFHTELHLKYQWDLFSESVPDSGLVVMARGLGIFELISSFVDLYASPKMLTFLLGASSAQEAELLNLFTAGEKELIGRVSFRIIKNDTPAKKRREEYLKGGVISITSRILLTDLLQDRIPIACLTAVLIVNANKVTEYSIDAFILELIRSQNHLTLIKSFSERPEAFVGGITKLERSLKSLKANRILLYPRFHSIVKDQLDSLEKCLLMEELQVGMSTRMKMIQVALVEVLESQVNEVLRNNPSLNIDSELDGSKLGVEDAVTGSIEEQIHRQLDPIWHRVSLKSKQLIQELRILRTLLQYLVQYDAITFLRFLETVILADASVSLGSVGIRSYWLMQDASQSAIATARERVYKVLSNGTLTPSIEKSSKWNALEMVLNEEEWKEKRIMIMVAEESTKRQLYRIISLGYEQWQSKRYQEFLQWRRTARKQSSVTMGIASTAPADPKKKKSKILPAKYIEREDEETGEDNIIIIETEEDMEEDINDINLPQGLSIHCFGEESESYLALLKRISPDKVVLYDSDLTFVRSLEVYTFITKSLIPDFKLSVSTLIFQDSVEEQIRLLSIRQEKEAFEKLIKAKANLAPITYETPSAEKDTETITISNRFEGFELEQDISRLVIVDVRELRSSLPFILYRHKFKLDPRTITVGDYILSPSICVERKSTSDLISSLNSGRLYTQTEQMFRSYETPILLIEFDEGKPFSLLPSISDIRSDISISDIASKLCLLLLHFPRLRIMWSSSLSTTAEMFFDLKRDQPDPVVEESAEVSEGTDPTARDLLMSLPGINSHNCFIIMRNVRDMRQLTSLSLNQIEDLIGKENGRKLHKFLHSSLY